MIGYEIATCNESIVCRCVWSRTIIIGYDITIISSTKNMEAKKTSKQRLGKARCAFAKRQNLWKSNEYTTTKTKIRLYNSNVKSILLYDSEWLKGTWQRSMRSTMMFWERSAEYSGQINFQRETLKCDAHTCHDSI